MGPNSPSGLGFLVSLFDRKPDFFDAASHYYNIQQRPHIDAIANQDKKKLYSLRKLELVFALNDRPHSGTYWHFFIRRALQNPVFGPKKYVATRET